MNRSVLELHLMGAFDRTRAKQAEVEAKVAAGQCLIDGCTCKPRSRGLCDHHRMLFYYELRHLETPEERAKFEADQVRDGKILLPGESVKTKRRARSPFTKVW